MKTSSDTLQPHRDKLDELCRERKLKTCEINKQNDFYGNASLLKRYAGLPRRYRLKALLEHSLFHTEEVWDLDRDALMPMNLSWSPSRVGLLEQQTGRPTVPIGFILLYAQRLHERLFGRSTVPRSGTIVFPYKSAPQFDTHFDHEDYAERLASLPAEMQPVAACIYWKDFLRGAHQPYERRGLRIVSAGHLFDQDFYLRTYDICQQYRYAVSNAFGTHLFVAVGSGCSFSYLESSAITRTHQGELVQAAHSPALEQVKHQAATLFASRQDRTTPEQQAFVDRLIGAECIKSPREMRRILLRAEYLDKFAPLPRPQHARGTIFPPLIHRGFRRLRMLARSIQKRLPLASIKGTVST